MTELSAPFIEQGNRRQSSFVTPVPFSVLIGASSTTIYTGLASQMFLLRALAVVNDRASAITLAITVGGAEWYTGSVAADTVTRLSAIEGMLLPASTNIAATGQNLRLIGWGVRVTGGDAWAL